MPQTTVSRQPVMVHACRVRRTRWVLYAGHVVDDLYQGAVPALIPYLALARHYDYTQAAGITLAATLLSSLLQPLFGVLTDRYALPPFIPVGMSLAGLGIGLSGLSESYALTWAAVALSGIGVAAYHPEAARAARVASEGSHTAMGWFSLAGTVGFALGPIAVPLVVETGGLGSTPALAVPALVMAVVTVLVLRRHPATATSPTAGPGGGLPVDQWGPFLRLGGVVVSRSVLSFGLAAFLALYAHDRLDTGDLGGEAALLAFFLASAAGTLGGGRLAERYSRVAIMRVSYAAAVPGLALLVLAPGPAFVLGVVWTGLAINAPFSLHVTLGQDYLPHRVGTASGVTLGLAVSVGGVAAPVLGALADATSLQTALTVLLAVPLVALAFTAGLVDPLRTRSPLRD